MTQNDPSDFTAAESGTAHISRHNTRALSEMSSHKGGTTPSYAVAGTFFLDDTDDPTWYVKMYDGAADIATPLKFDTTNNVWADPMFIAWGGTGDVSTATLVPALVAYAAGQIFYGLSVGANTGAMTLNINGLGAKAVELNGAALTGGEIAAASLPVAVMYDGTAFQLMGSLPQALGTGATPTFAGINLGDTNLDHFKVGTWTPAVFAGTTDETSGSPYGHYMRIGDWVWCYFSCSINTTITGSGNVTITGLPYTVESNGSYQFMLGGNDKIAHKDDHYVAAPRSATTIMNCYDLPSAGNQLGTITQADLRSGQSGKLFVGGFFYRIDT